MKVILIQSIKALLAGWVCLIPLEEVTADPMYAPVLGAASNFGQGWQPDMFEASQDIPVTDFRDAVYWKLIEKSDGSYQYEIDRTDYPDRLGPLGSGMSLTVNNGHPAYDGGHTPHSPEGVNAFARFAAKTVDRFSSIHSVEVGNEMNSDTFVSGAGWDGNLQVRAASYAALLKATAEEVRKTNPSVRILGGAAHSIPLAWFRALSDNGVTKYMDALVIHPYTVSAEQMQRQIKLLRQVPGFGDMPIEVTEFGTKDVAAAPAHLLKNYCQMALSGVTRVVWYPLNPRGDGLAPLLNQAGQLQPVGQTYQMIARKFAGLPVTDFTPDPFTYACLFGDNLLVIWGEPRRLTLVDSEMRVVDSTGAPVDQDILTLSRDEPVVVLSPTSPIVLGENLVLDPQQLIADSVHQFAYPGSSDRDPFERYIRQGGSEFMLETRPGQEKGGVPWTPYLGTDRDGTARAGADWILPSAWESGPLDIAYRYLVQDPARARIRIEIAPSERSTDGVELSILLNGDEVQQDSITKPTTITFEPMELNAKDILEFVVGPGATPHGDFSRFRVTILRDDT